MSVSLISPVSSDVEPVLPVALQRIVQPGEEVTVYQFSVEQYHQMIESGILMDDERVELLEGVIVAITPIGPIHRYTTRKAARNLAKQIPAGWDVWAQDAITLKRSEPIPDILVVRGSNDDYLDRHPGPSDIGLIVETSDSTLGRDRNVKMPVYAAAKVPQYWIINLVERQVEVYSQPRVNRRTRRAGYRKLEVYQPGQVIPIELDGQVVAEIAVSDLLPPERSRSRRGKA